MKVDLHLVSWQRPKMTELVIKTIARNTKRENYRLSVFDNGSGSEVQAMLNDLYEKGLIDELNLCETNVGLEPARSQMLHDTISPYFICIDNDCLPEPMKDGKDWTERLVELMEANPEYGAISCRTQVMVGTGNIFQDSDVNGDEITEFPWPGGSLRIMRTKETKAVGGWRDVSGRGQEERYICGELHGAGLKTGFATNIHTLHLFGVRGKKGTDRWGYPKHWKPHKSGHSNVYHPALENGDDITEVIKFSGEELAKEYFDADSSNP